MTYSEAMQFWYSRVNYEQRSAQPGDLKLDRMLALLDLLGNPQRRLQVVHVAGSKGKGSTSAMLATILTRAGYRTGLFTSPHLVHVEERFQVDGQPISPAELVTLLDEVGVAVRNPQLADGLTFFEIATAVGFLHFVRRRVQVAVLEVGLGGRFDSTNVCQPAVSIITSISFDHTQQLGNTLAKIAWEKAGIVKPGRPVVSGVRLPEPREVIERVCRENHAPLAQLGVDFHYRHEAAVVDGGHQGANAPRSPTRVEITTKSRRWPKMELALVGEHQAANAALVVAAVEELRRTGLHIADEAVGQGLAEVQWPARLQVIRREPLVVLDCAHNVASAQALVNALATSYPLAPGGRRLLIFASSRDKDIQGILQVLAPLFDHLFLTQFHNSTRFVAPQQLAELLPDSPRNAHTLCPDTTSAWHQALAMAQPTDLVCITGSLFLAGEFLLAIQKEK